MNELILKFLSDNTKQEKLLVLEYPNRGYVSSAETQRIADRLKESAQILTDNFLKELQKADSIREEMEISPQEYLDKNGKDEYWQAFGGDVLLERNKTAIKEKKQRKEKGYVYIAKEYVYGYFKIGKSKNPRKRIKKLHDSSMDRVDLVTFFYTANSSNDEAYLHDLLKNKHCMGEWFDLDEQDLTKIDKIMATKEINNDR